MEANFCHAGDKSLLAENGVMEKEYDRLFFSAIRVDYVYQDEIVILRGRFHISSPDQSKNMEAFEDIRSDFDITFFQAPGNVEKETQFNLLHYGR